MATYKLAVIIENQSKDGDFLLHTQTPPPKFDDKEYDSYLDPDLWDLPSAELTPLDQTRVPIRAGGDIDLRLFDVDSALEKVLEQVGCGSGEKWKWDFRKYVEEASFGPGPPVNTAFVVVKMAPDGRSFPDFCMWMCFESCMKWLLDAEPGSGRIGPLVVVGYLNDLKQAPKWKMPPTLRFQEYPPGVVVAPMGSRTLKPFTTTNLVVFAPGHDAVGDLGAVECIATGEALILDPGCCSKYHKELEQVIASLPRKLIVFVTHHHHDHVDGLSVVQKFNPDAILLAHENTMRRIGKGDWSRSYTPVSGGEVISIGGRKLNVISALGHTDGHMGLYDLKTHSLIVGDHCVGQGSAVLDSKSGGNMSDYFETTYRFLDIAPSVLIPMHGRLNLWPKNMLCGYLKNRRHREASILKAIEGGAQTLFDITSRAYADVDKKLWIPASSNVKLHVEHLAQQNKLPPDFSLENLA
uniref:Metallo-beta-lactamase domain-containing protein n=1 Tax=Kalanchoe fedtschenkoi TaxID=63787 RepID=A0A7N0ZVF6_KALFE